MPQTETITTYTFDELSDEAKEKAREWWREGGMDYDWYDSVEEDFKTIAGLMGITVTKIYFSGFWSQGDGACFEGSYHYEKGSAKKVIDYAPQDKELHRIATELYKVQRRNFYGISGTVKHSGHYYHKYQTEIDLYRDTPDGGNDSLKPADEEAVRELLRDLMDWLYRTLEKEYEYLNSDEEVDETIRINEYKFTEKGSRMITL